MGDIQQKIMKLARQSLEASTQKAEIEILTGCAACGARLVDDGDKPIAGSQLFYVKSDRLDSIPKVAFALCKEHAQDQRTIDVMLKGIVYSE